MWETSRFRGGKNQSGGNGNSPTGGGKSRKGRARMRMKRVQAQVLATRGWGVAATPITTRLILNDLGPQSVTLFSTLPLELGHPVSLTLEHPRHLTVRGKVTYCALFELTSRIHGVPRYPYRMQIEFDFLNDGEAQAVREYVEELTRNDLVTAA